MGFWRKQQITIFLTTKCNLKCSYCYMPKMLVKPSHEYIDINFARIGIHDFFSNTNCRAIRLFGAGEPTYNFKLMKDIWEIAYEEASEDLIVELETNGYFNDNVAEWIEKHVDILWISCDGSPDIQDKQRPTIQDNSSSGTVLKNVKRFAKKDNLQFGIRATISKDNINKQKDLIFFFNDLGVKYISASPTYYSKLNKNVKTPSLMEFANHFVPAFEIARELNMFYQTLMMVNFDEKVDIYCQCCFPTPRLTTDGYVSCCDWTSLGPSYLPHNSHQELIYGCYDKRNNKIIYDQKKIDRIRKRNVNYLNKSYCKNCEVLYHCAGGCLGKMIAETDNLYKATSEWCSAVRYLYRNLPKNNGLFPVLHP